MKNMNKKSTLLVLSLIGLLVSQCGVLDQDIDGNLSTYISVNETRTDTDIPYATTNFIDASSDLDISDNLDKISDWSVTEISYKVWGFYGDPSTTISGTLGFSRPNENTPSITTNVSSVLLNTISDDDTNHKVSLTENQLNTIAGYFKEDQAMKIYVDGILSQGPVYFDLEVFAKVKVKAKI